MFVHFTVAGILILSPVTKLVLYTSVANNRGPTVIIKVNVTVIVT